MQSTNQNIKIGGSGKETVALSDYKKVRNKIIWRLKQFYQEVTFTDADFVTPDIIFYCTINGNLIIKKFNAIEWIGFEKDGRFNEKYAEFTKSGKKSSIGISSIVGKAKPTGKNFRRKKLL